MIGVSSLLTWEGVKAFETGLVQEDREAMVASIVDESQWRPTQLTDKDYLKRVPGIFSSKCYELENMLMALNETSQVKASVLGVGVVYGKDNSVLQSEMLRCLAGE